MEIIAQFELSEKPDDKILRRRLKEMGVDARRLSRFTCLALLGALSLREHLNETSGLYLASDFNSPSKFFKMFNGLMNDNLPSPLDFMANINNAATFHLAQNLNLHASGVFLALNKENIAQLFQLAELDLSENQTALIGWVYESTSEARMDESCWWVVNKKVK